MVSDFIYPVLGCVHWVEYYRLRWGGDVGEVQARISELRFLHICLWWFFSYDKDNNGEKSWGNLKSMLDAIRSRWEKLEIVLASSDQKHQSEWDSETFMWALNKHDFKKEFEAIALQKKEAKTREFTVDYVEEKQGWDVPWSKVAKAIKNWSLWSMQIERTLEECKIYIRGRSGNLLHCAFKCRLAPSAHQMLEIIDAVLQHIKLIGPEMPKFLDAILLHIKALLGCLDGEAVPLKKQIETLEEKVRLLQAFFELIPNCVLELRDFRTGLYDDVNNDINKLVWLSFFFWAKAGDGDIASELNLLLFDMSQKITKPSLSDFTSWFFEVQKVMHPEDAPVLEQAVPGILDFWFNCLESPLYDDYHVCRDGMIMYFTFLANPPKEHAEDEELLLILDQLGNVLSQGFPLTPPVDDTENDSSEKEVYLSEFVTMVERLKGKIRLMHNLIPDSSSCNFPRTNGLGFIDFLLQNLKEKLHGDNMFIPFSKHVIVEIEQELASLRPDLYDIFELQKEHKELQEAWLQLISLAYLTEHTINSCPVILYPIWYNMVRLADILHEIKVVKRKLDNVKQSNCYNDAVLQKSVGSNGEIPTQAWYSGANDGIVGCKEEADTIVDQLTRESKSFEIVSIVGMGGSGKSTLAKEVYDAPKVRKHFHAFAFCIVSQVYSRRKLLLEILKDIDPNVNGINSKTDDDLAHLLHQRLSGRSYLVVMDDIWKIDAWEEVKSSFPKDVEGRVMFTTREREVVVQAQSSPHFKKLLSDEESWELLQKVAFPQSVCPPNLSDVAQVIARKCRGLPLAVVVIGRLLARKGRSLTLWNDIAEKTSTFAAEEGCMKVVELSYMHLPEHLKSCFLYLGVFDEDLQIPAKRLMLLWIAEGFVRKSDRESVEIVAEEYLKELVDRSLLEVIKRSFDNTIKSCRLHDVIGDFCQRKAQEENMFELIDGRGPNSSHSDRYRLSIHMDWESFLGVELRDQGIKSLLYNNASGYGGGYMFSKFQLVEVLDLQKVCLVGKNGEVDRVLEIITSLVHLRYLGVSIEHATNKNNILSRITNLKNLETLILFPSYTRFRWGENFWRMEKLRHLDVDRSYLITCSSKFEAYPPLYNLQCFSTLILKPGISMRILQKLPNLRKLRCEVYPGLGDESILALDKLNKLESLKLRSFDLDDVILPVTLKKLSLWGSNLPSGLGKLSHLEVLKLEGHRTEKWDIEAGEFPMLKFLKLKDSRLREWNVSGDPFPRLEQLVFDTSDYLHDIPEFFQESPALKKIKLIRCNSRLENSASEARDEQHSYGNNIELIILEKGASDRLRTFLRNWIEADEDETNESG